MALRSYRLRSPFHPSRPNPRYLSLHFRRFRRNFRPQRGLILLGCCTQPRAAPLLPRELRSIYARKS